MNARTRCNRSGVITTPPPPDAELLRLGALFDIWRAATRAAFNAVPEGARDGSPSMDEAYRVNDSLQDIADQIEAIPATTLAGLLVKRRLVDHCYGDKPVSAERLEPYPDQGIILIAQILTNLDAMGRAAA